MKSEVLDVFWTEKQLLHTATPRANSSMPARTAGTDRTELWCLESLKGRKSHNPVCISSTLLLSFPIPPAWQVLTIETPVFSSSTFQPLPWYSSSKRSIRHPTHLWRALFLFAASPILFLSAAPCQCSSLLSPYLPKSLLTQEHPSHLRASSATLFPIICFESSLSWAISSVPATISKDIQVTV